MPFIFGSKGTQNQWGFKTNIDKYNAVPQATAILSNFSSCTFNGIYAIYSYMTTGTTYNNAITLTNGSINLYVFAVAGGGAGGASSGNAGGGGAGGILQSNIVSSSSDNISITVGASTASTTNGAVTQDGNPSTFVFSSQSSKSLYAVGGGGGGNSGGPAKNGGSGGGAGSSGSGGSGTVGQGFAGGNANGGGGGAGSIGIDGSTTGAGGSGIQINTTTLSPFTNTVYSAYYWAGGGAGTNNSGSGGSGGGGGSNNGIISTALALNPGIGGSSGQGGPAGANTGGGGGAGWSGYGGAGGSGIILVAVPYSQIGSNTTDISTTGLVYKYIFNETTVSGTSVKNTVSNLADSTLTNASCYSTAITRIIGRGSLYGSSSTGLTVNTFNPLFTTGGVTICFWEYFTSFASGGNFVNIYSNLYSGNQGIMFGFTGSGTQITSWGVRLEGQFPNGTFTKPITVLNVWTHFTITINSTSILIYANGILQYTYANFALTQFTPTGFNFGNTYTSYYDDIRFYNRILSQSEILQLCAYVGN
jgi:hypothetical protein